MDEAKLWCKAYGCLEPGLVVVNASDVASTDEDKVIVGQNCCYFGGHNYIVKCKGKVVEGCSGPLREGVVQDGKRQGGCGSCVLE